MKKLVVFFFSIFVVSCTSNTIFKAPDNLIPKDTMVLLIHDLIISSSTGNYKNKNLERKVNYMPFVYDKFNIDSTRFKESNLYYISKIDLYQKMLSEVKTSLEKEKERLKRDKHIIDSIQKDSIKKKKKFRPKKKQ